jgi:RHS repeat-associated protein
MGSLIYESRDASGLYYRRNRYYDSEKGRFTQEDPIGLAGGLNMFGFAGGDPITYADPYGLRADTLVYDSPETQQIVEDAASKSPTLGESLEELQGNPNLIVNISQVAPSALGGESPGR